MQIKFSCCCCTHLGCVAPKVQLSSKFCFWCCSVLQIHMDLGHPVEINGNTNMFWFSQIYPCETIHILLRKSIGVNIAIYGEIIVFRSRLLFPWDSYLLLIFARLCTADWILYEADIRSLWVCCWQKDTRPFFYPISFFINHKDEGLQSK